MRGMWKSAIAALCACAAFAWTAPDFAAAQVAKSGKINGVMSWHFTTRDMLEAGENRFYWIGTSWGVFQTPGGQGFLNGTSMVCSSAWDLRGPVSNGSGNCLVTDAEGDKAYFQWKGGTVANAEWTLGDGEFTGGTGKFKGIAGKVNWKHKIVTARNNFAEGEGFSMWEGEYRLP